METQVALETNSKPKKSKKSLAVIIISAVILILVVLTFLVSSFLFKFAIKRSDGFDSLPPLTKLSYEDELVLEANLEELHKDRDDMLSGQGLEEVKISSFDGAILSADLISQKDNPSHNWAICVHGYRCDRREGEEFGTFYNKLGYNVLCPDLRGHGKSEGDYIGAGWLDRKDLISWISYIISRDKDAKIILHGLSMGASSVLMACGDEELPSNVVLAVSDCAYTSAWEIFSKELRESYHLPSFPIMNVASGICKSKAGYSFKEASALNQVKSSRVPILFIHGDADDFVPYEMGERLYNACSSEKDFFVAKNAGHAQAYKLYKDEYFKRVEEFISRYI